ncbi:integral membrane sensor signal transduction histidine kinase [Pseudodesulfovibrio mercurii]|uniref:histidine kinase n=1 Tax=Pseudodesulfovibrio mercurii TaxID=641491 RepID=F0JK24_9BACT|nr:ATP-binding protein [Pseudodesulfovibrio mercurii]EGB16273.1 integral membrane sensor signal transduction histidine kinase [Pseudodesulfovibrio mercurii]
MTKPARPPKMTPLGRKIAAAILGTTLVALALSFLLNAIPMVNAYRQEGVDKARSLAELMARSLAAPVDFDDPEAAAENLRTLSLNPNVLGAAVYLGNAAPFAVYGTPPDFASLAGPGVTTSLSALTVAAGIPCGSTGCLVVLNVSLAGQWGLLKSYLVSGGLILLGVFVFCFKLAGTFRRRLGDPLRELTEAIGDISGSRDYSRRVDYRSDDELGVLVAEFNAMLERIEDRDDRLNRHREMLEQRVEERTLQLKVKQLELLKNNRQLYSEIRRRAQAEMIREEVERINRHDLKSGLSLVIGYPELLLQQGDLSAEQVKLIKRIRAAGYRMLDMIRNHLDMFKMEKGVYALNRLPIDLVETFCDLEEELAPQLNSSGVRLAIRLKGRDVVGDETYSVSGEGPLLRTMCRNLVQNAIEASRPGDEVVVSLEDDHAGRPGLTVTNPTPVPPEVRERFFEKYVTHGKENGTGLGTYFAALIARTHGADIAMNTGEETGTTLRITFRR